MIARYSRPQMVQVWSDASRFTQMLRVEIAAQEELASTGWASSEAMAANVAALRDAEVWAQARPEEWVALIQEKESLTQHETLAFLGALESLCPQLESRFLHLGLTSSDVLDTALSLQIQAASAVIRQGLQTLSEVLEKLAVRYLRTPMKARTHGMTAEPTTFGFKVAGYLEECRRSLERLDRATLELRVGKVSGAVGTAQFLGPDYESRVLSRLGLSAEPIATQVIPRDRHAALVCTLAVIGGLVERLSVELRHLQRSEVDEVRESFARGQQGSSAMPHKKNPISAENLTGCARLLRSYAVAALENQALWHERDMSHSSVERVILPDAFILLDYALHRLARVMSGLHVCEERMLEALEQESDRAFSSQRLFELLTAPGAPLTRAEAYQQVQNDAFSQRQQLSEDEFEGRLSKVLSAVEKVSARSLRR